MDQDFRDCLNTISYKNLAFPCYPSHGVNSFCHAMFNQNSDFSSRQVEGCYVIIRRGKKICFRSKEDSFVS